MLRNIVLTTATAAALAFIAYSMPTVPTALATGVQLKPVLDPIAAADNVILVKKGGGGGGKSHAKGGGGGGKSHAKGGGGGNHYGRHDGGDKSHAKGGGGGGGGKSHAKRGGGKTIIVYRDGHRYWHDRRIWWWGPLVYSYDPCIRWVRFCPGCEREPINICYDEY